MKFIPNKKEGGGLEKALAMLKGGTTSFGVVRSLSHTEVAGCKLFPPF